MINVKTGYSYNDLLLVPKYSDICSRSDIDLSVDLGKEIKLKIPVISANMKHVTGIRMAKEIADLGGLALMHRFDTTEKRFSDFYTACNVNPGQTPGEEGNHRLKHIGFSVGVSKEEYKIIDKIEHVKIICVDIAHGDHLMAIRMIKYIISNRPEVLCIAGNVATEDAAFNLASAGAHIIKVGVGGGSSCTTRINTGNGVPMMTSLSDVYSYLRKDNNNRLYDYKIIADGGIQTSGHITMALCFSHAVMLGNLLAGTDEAPNDKVLVDGKAYKTYAGSSTHKNKHVEGVSGLVPYSGKVKDVIENLMQGVRSGCSYQGVKNLEELKQNPQFVSITNAGLAESRPHSLII